MINLKIKTDWIYSIKEEDDLIIINVNNKDRYFPRSCFIEFIENRIYVNGKLNSDLLEDD